MATALASTSTLRVRYAETDRMGVVYYANYFVWFEVARADWLRARGWSYKEMEATGLHLPVIDAHCEYRQSTKYDDEIEVHTEARLASPVRLEFSYEVRVKGQKAPCAVGRTVHAAIGGDGRPKRLPNAIREVFA